MMLASTRYVKVFLYIIDSSVMSFALFLAWSMVVDE